MAVQTTPSLLIPNENWFRIFEFLDFPDLLAASRVSKFFQHLSNDTNLWCSIGRNVHCPITTDENNQFKISPKTQVKRFIQHIPSTQLKKFCIEIFSVKVPGLELL